MGDRNITSGNSVPSATVDGLAQEVFNALDVAQAYASSSNEMAQNAIIKIQEAISESWPELGLTELELTDAGTPPIPPETVTFEDIELEVEPFDEEAPECEDIEIDIPEVPPYAVDKPALNIPDVPTDEFEKFTETSPDIKDPTIPDYPSYTLPPVPILNDNITVPSPPSYNLTDFEGIEPIADLEPPTEFFAYNEAEYRSDVKDALIKKVLYDIKNGGTGLNEELEQAIWDRAKARQLAEDEKAYLTIQNDHAASGFHRARGVTDYRLDEERERIRRANLDMNRDILIQSSDLAQKNTWFAIEQAINYEKSLMDHANQVAQRAFEKAKTVVELANTTYLAMVEAYKIKMEAYKVQAEVYGIKIQGEIAKAEFYKAQIEGLKVSAEINEILIRAYAAQCEGIKILVSMYGIEMEAAKIQADINKTQLETYKTKAEVYKINSEALIAKYNAYQIQIAGEAEKVKIYLSENQAYESQVKGVEAVASVANAKADLQIKKYQSQIEVYKAGLAGVQIEAQVAIEKAKAEAALEGLRIEGYKAENSAYIAALDAHLKSYIGRIEETKAIASISVKEAELVLNSQMSTKEIGVNAMTSMAKISSQMAAAALTAVNASMSLGESATTHASNTSSLGSHYSETHSHDDTKGNTSESHSVSENYNYNA